MEALMDMLNNQIVVGIVSVVLAALITFALYNSFFKKSTKKQKQKTANDPKKVKKDKRSLDVDEATLRKTARDVSKALLKEQIVKITRIDKDTSTKQKVAAKTEVTNKKQSPVKKDKVPVVKKGQGPETKTKATKSEAKPVQQKKPTVVDGGKWETVGNKVTKQKKQAEQKVIPGLTISPNTKEKKPKKVETTAQKDNTKVVQEKSGRSPLVPTTSPNIAKKVVKTKAPAEADQWTEAPKKNKKKVRKE